MPAEDSEDDRSQALSPPPAAPAEAEATFRASFEQWAQRTPLAAPALGLAAGIAGNEILSWPAWLALLVVTGGLAGLVAARRGGLFGSLCVCVSAIGAGAGLHEALVRRLPEDHVARLIGRERLLVRLTGTVATSPVVSSPPPAPFKHWLTNVRHTRFLLACEAVETGKGRHRARGLAQVKVGEPLLGLRAGQRVQAVGWMHRFRPPANPGQFDWSRRQARRGVFVGLSCEHADTLRILPAGRSLSWTRAVERLRRWARSCMLGDVLPDDPGAASLVEGMVLGQRSRIDRQINEAFIRTGTSHYLAVSGSHVTLLAVSLWGVASFVGVSQRRTALFVMTVILVFGLVFEPQAPAVRAVIITVTLCLSVIVRRPLATGNWIALSAVIILCVRPAELFEPGFQLSFGVLVGILLLHRPIRGLIDRWVLRVDPLARQLAEPTEPRHWSLDLFSRLGDWILWTLCASLAAWVVAEPLCAYHFQRVSLWSWLATLLLFPLVCLTTWAALLKGGVSLLLPTAGLTIGPLLAGPTVALRWAALKLSAMPTVSWEVPAPPGWWVIVGYALLALLLLRRRWRPLIWPIAACVLALIAGLIGRFVPFSLQRDSLRVRVLAVGDGCATLIELPNGRNIVYDAGSLAGFDEGASVIVPALRFDRLRRIHEALISHPNLDHYSSIPAVHSAAGIARLTLNEHFEPLSMGRATATDLLSVVRARGVPVGTVRAGDTLEDTGAVRCQVLWPPPYADSPQLSVNEASTVVRVEYGGARILMCGDIGEVAQRRLLEAGTDLRADVLILPHHGAVVASTGDFLRAIGARYLIRSSGRHEGRGSAALGQLVGKSVYFDTADDGAVAIEVSPMGTIVVGGFLSGRREPSASL